MDLANLVSRFRQQLAQVSETSSAHEDKFQTANDT